MSIWKRTTTVEALNSNKTRSMLDHLGIEFTAIGENSLSAKMPVDSRTLQPAGILHGGASVVLAETLGSMAAELTLAPDMAAVGLEINANHIKAVRSGWVTGTAIPVHLGRSTQVWEIKIINDNDDLSCISRITMAIMAPTTQKQ